MPIYEYQCERCKHQFEAIRKISDEPLTKCPKCGRATLKKLISKAAFRLKGGGWYETDFKSGDKKNVASSGESSDAATKSESSPSDGKSTETKSSAAASDGAGKASNGDGSKSEAKKSPKRSSKTAKRDPKGGGKKR